MNLARAMIRNAMLVAVAMVAAAPPAHAEAVRVVDPHPRSFEPGPVFLTAAQRRARAELIRDTAAASGMTNAALLAGIGEVETNFAHCWSEATWACQGPASSSCGGGPVIAGASDGACSLRQGGLGMFQFDAGTFDQTVATYGPAIVTLQGNVDAVIPFLLVRAVESVAGIDDEAEALAWMNSIRIVNGDPDYEAWLYFVAWRYNGCKGCTTQINKYRNGTNTLRDEFGAGFWTVGPAAACGVIPAAGRTIDDTDPCFAKRGAAASWYPGEGGVDGACLFTYATDEAAPDNSATWTIAVETTGRYRIEVYTDGGALGQSRQARYAVTHAGGRDEVVLDQRAAEGFQPLGDFELAAGETYDVTLGDNTGEPYSTAARVSILFDAVRVVPAGSGADRDGDGVPDAEDGGGCSAGQGGSATFGLALALVALAGRRRQVTALRARSGGR